MSALVRSRYSRSLLVSLSFATRSLSLSILARSRLALVLALDSLLLAHEHAHEHVPIKSVHACVPKKRSSVPYHRPPVPTPVPTNTGILVPPSLLARALAPRSFLALALAARSLLVRSRSRSLVRSRSSCAHALARSCGSLAPRSRFKHSALDPRDSQSLTRHSLPSIAHSLNCRAR